MRHNVIETSVHSIALSYSRVSLEGVAAELQLGNPEDAKFIVAKAIKEGVISAKMCHEKVFVSTKESQDIYSRLSLQEVVRIDLYMGVPLYLAPSKMFHYRSVLGVLWFSFGFE